MLTVWKPFIKGWKSKNEVTLYIECVSWILGCGSNITDHVHLLGFYSRGADNDLEKYGCCNVAHAKRTLHIKYHNNINNAMLKLYLKEKQYILVIT